MAHIDINLDDVPDYGELHPEGQLHVRVKKGEIKDTKDGSSKYVNWQLEPVASDNKGNLFLKCSLKREAQWNLKAFLKACRFQWERDGSFNTEDVCGTELFVTVGIDTYEGEKRNVVGPPYRAA